MAGETVQLKPYLVLLYDNTHFTYINCQEKLEVTLFLTHFLPSDSATKAVL